MFMLQRCGEVGIMLDVYWEPGAGPGWSLHRGHHLTGILVREYWAEWRGI